MAEALAKLEQTPSPFELNAVTRAYLEKMENIAKGQVAEDIRAVLNKPMDTAAAERLAKDPDVQLDSADDVRGDDDDGGTCAECAAAEGAGECELQDSAGALGGGDAAGSDTDVW